ncbi:MULTISPECIES: DUF4190 domain-containing protein [unclassified Microbacterium]|uniref:DUF4190 domain-containing protein n=1 Tax=unclassified Microbacterium TaxID=2609290 RepID=UPI00386FA665
MSDATNTTGGQQAQPASPIMPPAAPPQYSGPAYPAPGYATQGYGGGYGYAPARPTNALAIISLVAGIAGLSLLPFLGSIVAVITGHMSLRAIQTSQEGGRGMALAGTIIGWISLAFYVLGTVAVIAWFLFIAGTVASTTTIGS